MKFWAASAIVPLPVIRYLQPTHRNSPPFSP
jgi:hypothetical protein